MLDFRKKKILFFFIFLFFNLSLIYTNLYIYHDLYMLILIHGPLSKLFLIFVIIYTKIKNKLQKNIFIETKNYINNLITIIVTCYCESVTEIMNTIKSLEESFKYSNKKGIIFLSFDGLSKEENTNYYTWELVLEKMTSINKHIKNINYNNNWKQYPIKVDLILTTYKNLNIIFIIKKTNLGKKDSLNIVRDYSINKLDKNLDEGITKLFNIIQINRKELILVGSMDADCIVNKEGILELYNSISEKDVMGVSGIIKPKEDQKKNFWFVYQLTEYYNTQYITRLAYNYLNQTTCIPGALNIFDMKYYSEKIRKEFEKIPNKKSLFHSLISLIGEDRRFTGLFLLHNKNGKTKINENVIISTSLPDTTNNFKKQRRRWITSSLLNNYYDIVNNNINFLIKYNTFTTTLYSFLTLYIVFIFFYLLYSYFYIDINFQDFNLVVLYRYFIYFITFIIILFQITFLFKMKNTKERLQYILGLILFMLFIMFIIFFLIIYCLFNLDSLRWGNIKQNKEQEKYEISEDFSSEELEILIK